MKILADTHLLIWLATDSPKLTVKAKSLLLDSANDAFFSAASIWELAIKFALRRSSDFDMPPEELRNGLLLYGFHELPVTSEHGLAVGRLPSPHGDPFDRLLAAQALLEGITLLTADRELSAYPNTQLV
jgi:PIN domain nuclease of toxin-antitoxin system